MTLSTTRDASHQNKNAVTSIDAAEDGVKWRLSSKTLTMLPANIKHLKISYSFKNIPTCFSLQKQHAEMSSADSFLSMEHYIHCNSQILSLLLLPPCKRSPEAQGGEI
jgi:hypothetical protein